MSHVTNAELCLELAKYTKLVDEVLEDRTLTDFDNRLYFIGHLAMCARLFEIIHLDLPTERLVAIYRIETSSYGAACPSTDAGAKLKTAWSNFATFLRRYIESRS